MDDMDGIHVWSFRYRLEVPFYFSKFTWRNSSVKTRTYIWCFIIIIIMYRYWPNNSSRMYVLENTGEISTASPSFPIKFYLCKS